MLRRRSSDSEGSSGGNRGGNSLLERRRRSHDSSCSDSLKVDCHAANTEHNANNARRNLRSIGETYDQIESVGQGSTGVVFLAIKKATGDQVALKVVRTCDPEVIEIAKAEYTVLEGIQHPNIVRALDFFVTVTQAVLVMSFSPGDSLASAVKKSEHKQFSEPQSRVLFVLLLEALNYLHQRRILHRDIKPDNVMVAKDLDNLQIIDFNCAKALSEGVALTPNCTRLYAAPEVLKGSPPSEASDIWGAGLCLCTMISSRFRIVEGRVNMGIFERSVSKECFSMLGKCLAKEMIMRPAAMTLLQTAWALGVKQDSLIVPEKRASCSPHSRLKRASCSPRAGEASLLQRSSRRSKTTPESGLVLALEGLLLPPSAYRLDKLVARAQVLLESALLVDAVPVR